MVDAVLRTHIGGGARIEYDIEYRDGAEPPDTAVLGTEAHGSTDTLKQADGDRSANAPSQRRVDVFVELITPEERYAGASRVPDTGTKERKSRRWQVAVLTVASASLGASVGIVQLRLTNVDTGRSGLASFVTGGMGTKGLTASYPIGSDPVRFWTDGPKGFADFEGKRVRLTSFGFGLAFIGWEKAYLSFPGFGRKAQGLDVGGWSVGAKMELPGGTVVEGDISFDGRVPSDRYPDPGPDTSWHPYVVRPAVEYGHVAYFGTQQADLSDRELEVLRGFCAEVAARFASAGGGP